MTSPAQPLMFPPTLQFNAMVVQSPDGSNLVRLEFLHGQLAEAIVLAPGDAERIAQGIASIAKNAQLGLILPPNVNGIG